MAVPKRRTSKSRKNKRRASAYRLNKVHSNVCPECGAPKLAHRVCPSCGNYKGRQVVEVEDFD